MRQLQRLTRLLAAGLLLSGLSVCLFAQDPPAQDRPAKATTITGCLNKDASGAYVLTDENTGTKTPITGTADLEKHSANHRVTLTGTTKTDPAGNPVFEVSKIQHMATTCKAPGQ